MTGEAWQGLFDDYFREHTVRVLRERAAVPARCYDANDADTVKTQLIYPLDSWFESLGTGHGRLTEMAAALDLSECAELDIAYGFRYRQQVDPSHIDKLDRLWTEFQRLAAIGVVAVVEHKRIEAGKRNAKNAKGRHKPDVTGAQIRNYKTQFEYDNGRLHGWIAAAAKHFKVDRNTIKAHENDE